MFLNMFINYFLLLILFVTSTLSFFIHDLLIMWLIMEINNFIFISIISLSMKNKKMLFFYFIIQIIPSLILIMSISLNTLNFFMNNHILLLIYFSLMIKLGIPPFHFWMPLLSSYMNWNELFFLLIFQKIIPFMIFSSIPIKNYFLLISLTFCSIIPPLMMFNILNLKKLLTYSSINQTSWLLLLIFLKTSIWLIYLLMYMFIMMFIFYILSNKKMYYNFMANKNSYLNVILLTIMLNMSSSPPFSFFIFKWFSVFISIINSNLFLIIMIMILSSLIMTFQYLNMMFLIMYMNTSNPKLFNYKNLFNINYKNLLLLLITYIISLMFMIMI